jgi:hypothetical protein
LHRQLYRLSQSTRRHTRLRYSLKASSLTASSLKFSSPRLLQLSLISSLYSFLCGLLTGSDLFLIDLCLAILLLIGLLNIYTLLGFFAPVVASWDI